MNDKMEKREKSAQEAFWEGDFGAGYIDRNKDDQIVAGNIALFARALSRVGAPKSVVELGSNIGLNLVALQSLFPGLHCTGIEINERAAEILRRRGNIEVHHASLLDFAVDSPRDLSLIKGVLIHINPDLLPQAYQRLYEASSRHILICEYYNPTPVSIPYRGHNDRLFKRDFAGEMLSTYPDLRLVDYGFVYRRDPTFPLDDITWFLLEKKGA